MRDIKDLVLFEKIGITLLIMCEKSDGEINENEVHLLLTELNNTMFNSGLEDTEYEHLLFSSEENNDLDWEETMIGHFKSNRSTDKALSLLKTLSLEIKEEISLFDVVFKTWLSYLILAITKSDGKVTKKEANWAFKIAKDFGLPKLNISDFNHDEVNIMLKKADIEPFTVNNEQSHKEEVTADDILDFLSDGIAEKISESQEGKLKDVKVTGKDIREKRKKSKNRTELISALASPENSSLEEIKEIVNRKPDEINIGDPAESGYSALHYSTWDGLLNISEFLIESGSDINFVSDDSRTPIHLPSAIGRFECVKLLVKHGADINIIFNAEPNPFIGNLGSSALKEAVLNQRWNIVDFLIENNANLEILKDPCSDSPYGTSDFLDSVKILGEKNEGKELNNRHNPGKIDELKKKINKEK